MSETIEQVAAEVLAEHGLYLSLINQRCICTCGENYPQGSTLTAQAAHCAHVASVLAARLDDGLRAGVEALADEWDDAHNLGIQTSYATCADDLRALLDQPHTGTER